MRKVAVTLGVMVALLGGVLALTLAPEGQAARAQTASASSGVEVELFAPESGDVAGRSAKGFFVDLEAKFPTGVAATGAREELSGPGVHANAPPFPSAFAPGKDDAFPGLIVLFRTTKIGAGSGQNLAGLFNLVGFTNREPGKTHVWATWIVGDSLFGQGPSRAFVAIAKDKDKNGVYDDAPNAVPDADGNGVVNAADLRSFGVASNVESVPFTINPNP